MQQNDRHTTVEKLAAIIVKQNIKIVMVTPVNR